MQGSRARHAKGTPPGGISPHQAAAAAAPHRPARDLVDNADEADSRTSASRGNFQDFDQLFEQLAQAPVMTLGHPLPNEKYLPKPRAGSCQATHNEQLLREEET